jgi:hypothetical protein
MSRCTLIPKRSKGPIEALAYLFAVAFICPLLGHAQAISVSSGALMSLGTGLLDAGCGDLNVAGTFSVGSGSAYSLRNVTINPGIINGGSGSINLSGDWNNQGTFNRQAGRVEIQDGCSTSVSKITGDTTFNQFRVATSSGKQLQPAAGSTQIFTGALDLSGPPSDRLLIRTSSPGATAEFILNPGASQRISGVDVQDIESSAGETIAPGPPSQFQSVDSGNNSNWFIAAIRELVPVTTLPTQLLALLGLLIFIVGATRLKPEIARPPRR